MHIWSSSFFFLDKISWQSFLTTVAFVLYPTLPNYMKRFCFFIFFFLFFFWSLLVVISITYLPTTDNRTTNEITTFGQYHKINGLFVMEKFSELTSLSIIGFLFYIYLLKLDTQLAAQLTRSSTKNVYIADRANK